MLYWLAARQDNCNVSAEYRCSCVQAAADDDALTATMKAVMRLACKLDVAGMQQRCPRSKSKSATTRVKVQMAVT